ncbi:hypothetical protein VNO80_17169 [Phaseolus coccineus]|uniref:TF-B3 domain-containing protein n=1 Tax=Phaseolus coccineus TaxID=3886 RepID=A0AAN9R3E1_PHACN
MAAHPPIDHAILPIRFFKTILKSNLLRLVNILTFTFTYGSSQQIPNKFTIRYGENLSNPVFLRPPDGTQWKVYWTKQKGEIWFEKGWKEFVENYSLDHGHFVFFTFDGTSKIDVVMVDQSALDMQYPSSHTPEQSESLGHSDDESFKILDEGPDSDQHAEDDEVTVGNLSLNWPRVARAKLLARKFISCNPFFTVVIRSYNLTTNRLNIPNLEGYIDKRKKYVTVEVGGKSWSLRLVGSDRRRFGGGWRVFAKENDLEAGDVLNWKEMDAEVWLIDEWKKFAEFFSLDQNHLLVFRYVGKSQFKVVILDQDGLEIVYPLMEGSLDGADNGSSSRQRREQDFLYHLLLLLRRTKVDNVYERGRKRNRRCSRSKVKTESGTALERAKSFHSKNPYYIRVMHRSYIVKKFLMRNERETIVLSLWNSEDRSWDVNFHVYRSRKQVSLGSGWADFVEDNNLKKGNICVFGKIKDPGVSFRVFFYRDPQESSPSNFSAFGNDGANESKQTGPQNTSADRGSDGVPRNVFYDSKFRGCDNEISENHFALSVLTIVYIPEQLIRNHEMENAAKVGLRVGNRTWPVKLEHYPENKWHKLCYSDWSEFMRECSGIHFFKRIEEDTLRNGDLRIPRSFVSKHWEDISNPLRLLLPEGGEWKVNWKKIGVDIWLIDKWKKFVEFYSLDQDNLLIFKYVGMSQFEVVILDQSGLEIVYPLMEANLDAAENGNSSCQFKKGESSLPGSHFSKKVKANNRRNQPNISTDVENMRAQSQRFKVEFHGTKLQTRGRKRKTYSCMKSSNSKGKAIATKSDTAWERAKSFHSENRFFIREMNPSYIQRNIMVMPGNIITKEEEEEHGSENVTLWTSEEDRHWLVHFYRNYSSGQISLTSGWKHFAKDHNLQMGDVCVFEKIKKSGISFRVFIYSNKQEPSSPKFSDYETPKCNNMVVENHFSVCINDKQLYAVKVPKIFFENHGIAKSTEVILQLGKRSWNVKLDPYCRFTKGWNDFMRECRLKGGDICVLELIDKKKIVFEVSILACIE